LFELEVAADDDAFRLTPLPTTHPLPLLSPTDAAVLADALVALMLADVETCDVSEVEAGVDSFKIELPLTLVMPEDAKLEFEETEFGTDNADVIKADPFEFKFDDAVGEADVVDDVEGVVTLAESIGIAKLADEETLVDTIDEDETARFAKAFVNKLTPGLLLPAGCDKVDTDPLTPVLVISLEGDVWPTFVDCGVFNNDAVVDDVGVGIIMLVSAATDDVTTATNCCSAL